MKQKITAGELNNLNYGQLEKIRIWADKKGYDYELSIGQMIELLSELDNNKLGEVFIWDIIDVDTAWQSLSVGSGGFESSRLCDALWQAVKEVLK